MLEEALAADPNLARRVLWPLAGTVFAIAGGTPATVGRIAKIVNVGPPPVVDDSVMFELNNKIGIGRTDPAYKLDVLGDARVEGDGAALRLKTPTQDTGSRNVIKFENNEVGIFSGDDHKDQVFAFFSNAAPNRLKKARLQVFGSETNGWLNFVDLSHDGTNGVIFTNVGHLILWPNTGKVGIGTTNPAEKLDVAGNILSQGLNKIVFLKPGAGVDPTDDGKMINDIINSTPFANGGIIMLTPGPYNVKTTVSVTKSGVKLRGYGGAQPDPNLPSGSPLTKLLWAGSSGGTVVSVGTGIQDVELSDVTIDGNSESAGMGLSVDGVVNSRFTNIAIYNVNRSSGIGLQLKNSTALGVNWNLFENISVFKAWRGVVLDSGHADGNPSHNTFLNLNVQKFGSAASGAGLWLGNCDNNSFHDLITGMLDGIGSGFGVVISNPETARSNYFYHLQAGGGGLRVMTNISHELDGNESKNLIFGYDRDNPGGGNEPEPSTDNGAYPPENFLSWTNSKGEMHAFPIQAADVPGLDASKIVSGTLSTARIPDLSASKITSGTFDAARLPDASASAGGKVTASAQTFAGLKTFQDGVDGSGSNAGVQIRSFSSNTRPTLRAGEVAFWTRPSDGYTGLLYRYGNDYFWLASNDSGGGTVKLFGNP